jgi:hypothetical protein
MDALGATPRPRTTTDAGCDMGTLGLTMDDTANPKCGQGGTEWAPHAACEHGRNAKRPSCVECTTSTDADALGTSHYAQVAFDDGDDVGDRHGLSTVDTDSDADVDTVAASNGITGQPPRRTDRD